MSIRAIGNSETYRALFGCLSVWHFLYAIAYARLYISLYSISNMTCRMIHNKQTNRKYQTTYTQVSNISKNNQKLSSNISKNNHKLSFNNILFKKLPSISLVVRRGTGKGWDRNRRLYVLVFLGGSIACKTCEELLTMD